MVCPRCNGCGTIPDDVGYVSRRIDCPTCRGSGIYISPERMLELERNSAKHWVEKGGQVIPLREMSCDHIVNTINSVRRDRDIKIRKLTMELVRRGYVNDFITSYEPLPELDWAPRERHKKQDPNKPQRRVRIRK